MTTEILSEEELKRIATRCAFNPSSPIPSEIAVALIRTIDNLKAEMKKRDVAFEMVRDLVLVKDGILANQICLYWEMKTKDI